LIDLESIVNQCKKNNKQAQATLYNWLAPKIVGLCLRYMQNRDEAEDVMQDTFVKLFSNLSSYKSQGSFEGWAKRIAANTALSALRKKNQIHFERNLQVVENIEFEEEEVEHLSLQNLLACLETLPAGYRTIINLYLIDGFSHKEIGEKLGIAESTSRSQFTRARQMLMKLIKSKNELTHIKNA
jgi:RNA polymerase sigma-70 factor (ECF subfamily)